MNSKAQVEVSAETRVHLDMSLEEFEKLFGVVRMARISGDIYSTLTDRMDIKSILDFFDRTYHQIRLDHLETFRPTVQIMHPGTQMVVGE